MEKGERRGERGEERGEIPGFTAKSKCLRKVARTARISRMARCWPMHMWRP